MRPDAALADRVAAVLWRHLAAIGAETDNYEWVGDLERGFEFVHQLYGRGHDLERAGVLVRGRGEIAALHGTDGQLEAATLRDGERIPLSFLFLFLGAAPHTDWLGGTVALDDDGFVLTGQRAGAEGILETSVPGVFAVGDVRSGSVKRCAAAVGEGATVVRFVHERFSADVVDATPAAGS